LAHLIRGLQVGLLLSVTISGALLGWLLAKSPLPGWLAGIVSFILGAEAMLVWGLARASAPVASPAPGVGAWLAAWLARLSTLVTQVHDWLRATVTGETAFDPLASALVWGLLLWMLAVWAGWALRRRRQPLQAILPSAILLAFCLSYAWANPNLLALLLGATMLQMALTRHKVRERHWQMHGIDYSPELWTDLALITIPLALALMMVAFVMPTITVRPTARIANRLLVEHMSAGRRVADALGLEPVASRGSLLGAGQASGLPNQRLLGSGPELSEQINMIITPEGFEGLSMGALRIYWRALTYDAYTGQGWRSSAYDTVDYAAGEFIPWSEALFNPRTHRTLRQRVQIVGDVSELLYRAGELLAADHAYQVAWRAPNDAFAAEIKAKVYRVDSSLSVVNAAQLRDSGDNYPPQLIERYLSLPPDIPERVLALARELTAAKSTLYERTRAIETYLRAIPYTLDVPVPPPNRDMVDYFLFDLQRGYCDYYATAMVVLARATGIPARLVVGYAPGTYDEATARYVVTAADAHAWVEIYFPDYGWVEFEPTGGRPAIKRAAEVERINIPDPLTPLEPRLSWRIGPGQLVSMISLGGLVCLLLGTATWQVTDKFRLKRLSPAESIRVLYQRLYRHGQRLGVLTEPGDTPYEFMTALTDRVAVLAPESKRADTLGSALKEAQRLTELYVQALYSPDKPTITEQRQALRIWQRLRHDLWVAWLRRVRRDVGPGPIRDDTS
jgi:transglutaminase-like putative cysteine protease